MRRGLKKFACNKGASLKRLDQKKGKTKAPSRNAPKTEAHSKSSVLVHSNKCFGAFKIPCIHSTFGAFAKMDTKGALNASQFECTSVLGVFLGGAFVSPFSYFVYVHICMYVCMCVCAYMYVCMYVCMCIYVCVCLCTLMHSWKVDTRDTTKNTSVRVSVYRVAKTHRTP